MVNNEHFLDLGDDLALRLAFDFVEIAWTCLRAIFKSDGNRLIVVQGQRSIH